MSETGPRINPNLRPPGGYKFIDGDKVVHVGTSLRGLVLALQAYRHRIGHAPGNPEAEVLQQICRKHPRVCVGYKPAFEARTLVSQVGIRAAQLKAAGGLPVLPRVPSDTVAERARICENCRFRVNWVAECKPCEKKIGALVESELEGFVPVPSLKGEACALAMTDLQLATLHPKPKRPLDAPEHCWMGKDVCPGT